MSSHDFTPEELEFRREIEPVLSKQRATAGTCPHPDVLMAARSGVLTDSAESVERHLQSCPACRQLSEDLASYQHPGASKAEDRRIRAGWGARPQSRSGMWGPWALAAAFGMVAILAAAYWFARAPIVRAPAVASTPAPLLLAFEKAPIRIPAAAVLTFRGDSNNGEKYLKDLAAALDPYRAGDYAGAEQRLAGVSRDYPGSAEAAFYLGVSQLLLGENDRAVESLKTARQHAGDTLRDAVEWYSTVALNRAGRNVDALQKAEGLCARAGEFKEKACSAAAALKPR